MEEFPQVKFNDVKQFKLFNAATMRYLCLTDEGFITTLNPGEDSKVAFDLHFFHTLDKDRKQTQLVVPVHSSHRCLAMTPDKELVTSKKNVLKLRTVKKADSTFFYYKTVGSPERVVFEGMNGNERDSNYYLAVNENNMCLQLEKKIGDNFPENMIFQRFTANDYEL